jgi:hypothetical protein
MPCIEHRPDVLPTASTANAIRVAERPSAAAMPVMIATTAGSKDLFTGMPSSSSHLATASASGCSTADADALANRVDQLRARTRESNFLPCARCTVFPSFRLTEHENKFEPFLFVAADPRFG